MENEVEIRKTHNTHILSGSSEDDEDYLNKSNADLFLPEPNEEGDFNIHKNNKINIKDLFKNITEREDNKIIYLDENDIDKEEIKENEEILKYFKSKNNKKGNKKNITGNLKDLLIKKTLMQEMNAENFELLTGHREKRNENEIDNSTTDKNKSMKYKSKSNLNKEDTSFNNDSNYKKLKSKGINKIDNLKKKKKSSNESSRYIKNSVGKKTSNFNSSEDDEENENENKSGTKLLGSKRSSNSKRKYKNNEKKNIENNKVRSQKLVKNKYSIRDKSKSKSKDKSKDNYYSKNINNSKSISKNKDLDKSQNKKLKNQKLSNSNKESISNSISNIKDSKKRDTIKVRNFHSNKSKIKSSGDMSIQNKKIHKLYNLGFPKYSHKQIKKEIKLPVLRKCHFSKAIIQMNKEQFTLLNEKIKENEKKNLRHKRNNFNQKIGKNKYMNDLNFFEEINNKRLLDFDYENNNNQDFLNIIDISKYNNNDIKNQKHFIYKGDLNSYMNSRIISPSILNRKKRKNYKKNMGNFPISPYLLNKINFSQKPLSKSNSALNIFNNYNKNSKKKFPNINNNHNSLKSLNSNMKNQNSQNEINVNFFKTNTILNFNPKNSVVIPVMKDKPIESLKSANYQKMHNSYFKSLEVSTPTTIEVPSKINIDLKHFHNIKKFHIDDKEYGRHFGNEQDCPVCQSVSMKINYNMKNINHYNDFIKERDKKTIKYNKLQFLNDLKKPNTQSEKMEALIIKEIKQFINNTKKTENFSNNDQNEGALINAYFG